MRFLTLLMLAGGLVMSGCGSSNNSDDPADASGLVSTANQQTTNTTVAAIAENLRAMLDANDNISVVNVFDHAANAQSAGMDLPPTTVIIFGNPALGTPLMQAARTTGIDLPQKFLVFQEGDDIFVSYNGTRYLMARHDIQAREEQLNTIAGALRMFAQNATGADIAEDAGSTAPGIDTREGVVISTSNFDFDTTATRLQQAIEANSNLSLVDNLDPFDHAANAQTVNMDLPPTQLFVFGNPALGTPLMQSARTFGIDLPQKILVYQVGDDVFVAYNDPFFLAARHNLANQNDRLETIAGALANLAQQATTDSQ